MAKSNKQPAKRPKKVQKTPAQYKTEARKLKKLGLVKADLRRSEFDGKTKAAITRAAKKYDQYIRPSKTKKFESRYIPDKATRDSLQNHDYTVIGKHAIIDVDQYASVKIQKSYKLPGGKRVYPPGGVIKRKIGKKVKIDFLASGMEMNNLAFEIDDQIESMPESARNNITIGGKIGDNAAFKYSNYDSAEELLRYMTTQFQPKREGKAAHKYRRAGRAGKARLDAEREKVRQDIVANFSIVAIED